MRVLVTGAAGFIGYHTATALLARGDEIVGLDNLNAFYDVNLKLSRLERLESHTGFTFHKLDLADRESIESLFRENEFERVIHLGAQAGVRYSLTNPHAYVDSNITGTLNILEGCRTTGVKHLVYASSSSVYGANERMPFSEKHGVDHPLSLYAATKKSNELMAHVYASLYGLPVTGLRFFTVYGPWGRPDMALFRFTKNILAGEPIEVYNNGRHSRDFTYIDDIVDGILKSADRVAAPDPQWSPEAPDPAASFAPFKIYNIGNGSPVELSYFIECLENELGRKAEKTFLPRQAGDVEATYADTSSLSGDTGFGSKVPVEEGIKRFVAWYREYYGV